MPRENNNHEMRRLRFNCFSVNEGRKNEKDNNCISNRRMFLGN